MQITDLRIRNFKSIKEMHISGIENALILVGKNDTGKTAVLDAVRAVGGDYIVKEEDFRKSFPNVEICVELRITSDDLKRFHRFGLVSSYRRYEAWYQDFCRNSAGSCRLFSLKKVLLRTAGTRARAVYWLLSLLSTARDASGTVTGIRRITDIFLLYFRIFILWMHREIWRSSRMTCF